MIQRNKFYKLALYSACFVFALTIMKVRLICILIFGLFFANVACWGKSDHVLCDERFMYRDADDLFRVINSASFEPNQFNLIMGQLLYTAIRSGDQKRYADYLTILAYNKLNFNLITEADYLNGRAGRILHYLKDYNNSTLFFINQIRLFRKQGKYGELQSFLDRHEPIEKRLDKLYLPVLYRELAYLANYEGNTSLCRAFLDKSKFAIDNLKSQLYKGSLYSGLGISSRDLGYTDLAADCFEQALSLFRTYSDSSKIVLTYVNLSGLLAQQYHLDQAKSYCLNAVRICSVNSKRDEFRPLYSYALNAIGDLYLTEKAYKKADSIFKIAIDEIRIVGDSSLLVFPLCNRSYANLKMGKIYLAQQLIERASKIGSNSQDLLKIAVISGTRGLVSYELGDLSSAEADLLTAIKGVEELGVKELCLDYYKSLAELESKRGNFQRAFWASNKYRLLNDSLKRIEATHVVADFSERIKNSELESEIEKLLTTLNNKELFIKYLTSPYSLIVIIILLVLYLLKQIYQERWPKRKRTAISFTSANLVPLVTTHGTKDVSKVVINDSASEKGYILKDSDLILKQKLENALQDQKLWRDPELNMVDLAMLCHTNTTYLSRLINRAYGINFSTYINRYRIKDVCTLLEQGEASHQTIEALALRSGFKSRSSFHGAFKREQGITPTQFLEQLGKERLS